MGSLIEPRLLSTRIRKINTDLKTLYSRSNRPAIGTPGAMSAARDGNRMSHGRLALIGSAVALYILALAGLRWPSGSDAVKDVLTLVIIVIPPVLAYVVGRGH